MEKVDPCKCILCPDSRVTKQFTKGKFDIVKCGKCGLAFVSVLPSVAEIADYYNQHGKPTEERIKTYLGLKSSRERRNARKLRLLENIQGHKGRLLDIGCGLGLFVKSASDRGWEAEGVDLDKDMIDYGRETLHVNLHNADLPDVKFPDNHFDAITMFNLLDHIREPKDFLKEVERILKPGGIIYLNVHDAEGWKAKKNGANWGAYCPPGHLYYYSHNALKVLLNEVGLKFFMVPGINMKEGIKMLAVKKDDPRNSGAARKIFEKCVYACVQALKL